MKEIVLPTIRPVPLNTRGRNVFRRMKAWLWDARMYEVVEDYSYKPKDHVRLTIPKGFKTDFASSPRLFWLLGMAPTGILLVPSLFHDFGYQNDYYLSKHDSDYTRVYDGVGKNFHDRLMRQISAEVNEMLSPGWLSYIALSVGGWPAWWSACRKRTKAE